MLSNDDKILDLKRKIESKKDAIKKNKSFAYTTNCILELDGKKYNLHVLKKEDLMLLGAKINLYNNSSKDLFKEELVIGAFSCEEWLSDIKTKYNQLCLVEEEKQLNSMEKKLSELLSRDKKVELEIDSIEEKLGLI